MNMAGTLNVALSRFNMSFGKTVPQLPAPVTVTWSFYEYFPRVNTWSSGQSILKAEQNVFAWHCYFSETLRCRTEGSHVFLYYILEIETYHCEFAAKVVASARYPLAFLSKLNNYGMLPDPMPLIYFCRDQCPYKVYNQPRWFFFWT